MSRPIPQLRVQLVPPLGETAQQQVTGVDGLFTFRIRRSGIYRLQVDAPGFKPLLASVEIPNDLSPVVTDVQLNTLVGKFDSMTVSADLKDSNILFPDPGQRIFVREETLDANPGRPGTPISIPGLPAQTASGGIKAPQYFAPGVAGDHGEPIAQYIQVGTYLLPNNLSANAHGNGYADPNILIPIILEGVQTDGGAFNVREGNHAENLSLIYQLRQRFEPFITLTGDAHDIDVVAGWVPGNPESRSWLSVEAAYGNGFLNRLEHRQQYKFNGFHTFDFRHHQLTLFGIGYYGVSFISGLVPLNTPMFHDTIDSRQHDQTHTGVAALNDKWKLSDNQELQLSGFFRTYNLALLSNFGDGLIRQSEFRTETGGNATYLNHLNHSLSILAGFDYQRSAPRRLNLDHYQSTDPSFYGPFDQVLSNNVTIADFAPFLALDGSLWKDFHYNLGWRRDQIRFDNGNLLNPLASYRSSVGFNSPKATLSYLPEGHPALPSVSASFGQAFFTDDPRIGTGTGQETLISREHAYQLVVAKQLFNTNLRVVLGHQTTEATFAKLDPDTGLTEYQGPGKNRYIAVSARRYFGFGLLEGSVSKADARDLLSGLPTPEAPRLIVDFLGITNKLPYKLEARGEWERVGVRPLGDGFRSVPITEFRGALFRSFQDRRMSVGVNFLLESGYTGQTLQTFALPGESEGSEHIFGVRLPSYVSLSYTYRFRPGRRP